MFCTKNFKISTLLSTFKLSYPQKQKTIPSDCQIVENECFVKVWDTAQNEKWFIFPSCVYKCVKTPWKNQELIRWLRELMKTLQKSITCCEKVD